MTKFSKFDRSDYINSPEQASEYLQVMFNENGLEGFYKALGDVAKAKGMSNISEETKLGRESLYKALSENGNPKFSTVAKTLESLNINMKFEATH